MTSRSEEARLSRLMRPTFAARVRTTVAAREREKREKRLRERKKRRSNSHQDGAHQQRSPRHGSAAEKQHEREQGVHDSGLGNVFKSTPTSGSSGSRSRSRRNQRGKKRHNSQATPDRRASLRQLIREEARAACPTSSEPHRRHRLHHGGSDRSSAGSTSSDTGTQQTDSDAQNDSKDNCGAPEAEQKAEMATATFSTTHPSGTRTDTGHEPKLLQPPVASSGGDGHAGDADGVAADKAGSGDGGGGNKGDTNTPVDGDKVSEGSKAQAAPSKKSTQTQSAGARDASRTASQRISRGAKPSTRAGRSGAGAATTTAAKRHGKRGQGKAQQQEEKDGTTSSRSRSRSGMRWERPWRVNAARKTRSGSCSNGAGASKAGARTNKRPASGGNKGPRSRQSASKAQGTSSPPSAAPNKRENTSSRGEAHAVPGHGEQQLPLQVLDATLTSIQELNELQTNEQVLELPTLTTTTTPQAYLSAMERELASFSRCFDLEAMVIGSITEEHVLQLLSIKMGTLRLRAVVTATVLCALEMVHEDTEHLPPWDSLRRIIKRRNLYPHIVSFDVRRWLGKHHHTLHLLDPLIQLSIQESQEEMGDSERLLRNWVHMQRRMMAVLMRMDLLEDRATAVAPITAGHLREIKALKRTHEPLQRVIATAMLLSGHATSEDLTSWETVKHLLNSDFVKRIMSAMPHTISADAIARARAHMRPLTTIPCSQVRKKSVAVGQLLEWATTSIAAHLITKAAETRVETDL